MELTWIDDFIALDRTKNFTRAAEQRCTTQPAFSRRIQSLEQWIGTPLFERNNRSVTLTPSGKECKKRIYRLREDMLDLRRIANLSATNLSDDAKIIYTTNTVAIGFLPQWLKQAGVDNYRLVVSSVSQALEMVRKGGCDYALLPYFDFWDDGLFQNAETLYKDRLVFISPQGQKYEFVNGQLSGNIMMYSPKTAFGQAIDTMMQKYHISLDSAPVCESASAEALLAQIKSGNGCGWVVESLLPDGHALNIETSIPTCEFEIRLVKA